MNFRRCIRVALLASALCCAMLSPADTLWAAPFAEFVDPNPAAGNQFGNTVVPLSTGNVVVTAPSTTPAVRLQAPSICSTARPAP